MGVLLDDGLSLAAEDTEKLSVRYELISKKFLINFANRCGSIRAF